ncbi:fibronectin type III domain-containing protein [Haloflavibacter putidus]|uniref:T9SS type A sorting domain-containing protein n=1 Tax=Haloflavibacter putidus TaxID=2576776 RepID=A0A507ZNP5_9FLAO|nr:fibronectin type III domain-containing protein [Haloflavibacter putidus]TQD39356.1 T9SS type A sorting domain-containing protein [Haloflavibacter putidus]
MYKTTILSLLFFCVTSIGLAQIDLNENFNENNAIPADWSTNGEFASTPVATCEGNSLRDNLWTNSTLGYLYTPNLQNQSTGTIVEINFDYKIVDYISSGLPNQPTQPGWGNMKIAYTIDGGNNWINIHTINDSNHTTSNTCANVNLTIPEGDVPSGSDFQLRFETNWNSGDFYIYIDNVSIIQDVTTPPNCDLTLINPTEGVTNASTDGNISWTPASGGVIGYELNVGTTSGGTNVVENVILNSGETSYSLGQLVETTTYYVQITPYNNIGQASGCSEFSFTTTNLPANDACSNAIQVYGPNYTNTQDASNATNNDGFINSSCGDMNDGVWYTFIGDGGQVTITLEENTNWNAALGIYTGECSVLLCETVEETTGGNLSVSFESVLGTTYYLNVGNQSGTTDNPEGEFTITYESIVNPCPEPSNLMINNVTHESADVSWIENGDAVEWNVEYGEQGFTPGSGTVIYDDDATPDTTLINLEENTTYDVYVSSFCPPDAESDPIGPVSFTTLVNPQPCAQPSNIIVAIEDPQTAEVTWTENGNSTEWEILYGTIGFDPDTEGDLIVNDSGTPSQTLNSLTPSSSYDVYVRAVCENETTDWTGPETFTMPSSICADPSDIVVQELTNSSVQVTWTENGSANEWKVEYGLSGFDPETEGTTLIDDNGELGVSITGLQEDQAYDVYVTAICGDAESERIGPKTFTIELIGVENTNFANFTMYPNPAKQFVNFKAEEKIETITLFDLKGRVIKTKNMRAKEARLNVQDLAAGIYLVKIRIKDKTKTLKFIKE